MDLPTTTISIEDYGLQSILHVEGFELLGADYKAKAVAQIVTDYKMLTLPYASREALRHMYPLTGEYITARPTGEKRRGENGLLATPKAE
jgi:hypothetical protein